MNQRDNIKVMDTTEPSQSSHAALWTGALVTFTVVFAYRWLTVNFTNDQFVALSRAQQIVRGEVPVRDFFDPGLFLQHYASAAALSLSGGTLFGEAVLTICFISLGAALTYMMATVVSRSWMIGAVATATAVATFPRLYNYPKAFLFVLAIACAWRYGARPTAINATVLAVVTAVAFFFRYDLGAYIAIAVTAFLIVLHWPRQSSGMRPLGSALGLYAGVIALLVLPFLVFIQIVAGLPRYLGGLTSQARDVTTFRLNAPPFRFDWTQPLVHVDPPSEARIHVRWKPDVSDEARRDTEVRHGLSRPIHEEGTTWSYVIIKTDRNNIATLLTDALVEDTNGIDRERMDVALRESPFRRAQRRLPILRMQIGPGIVTFSNSIAWLYYVTLALPVAAGLTLIAVRRSGQQSIDRSREIALALMLIVLCTVVGQSLVREAPETRLPDVAAPMAVLGAWIAGVWIHGRVRLGRALRVATLAFGIATFWAAAEFGELADRILAADMLTGLGAVQERFVKVNNYLTTDPPIDAWDDKDSIALRALAQWIRACTAPTDRVLVVGWAADLYFYANRPFAGGQVYLYPNWHSSVADQELTVQRLKHQRVPVAISPVESQTVTRQSFPIVLDYVDRHYVHVMRGKFGSTREYDVLVRRDIPRVRPYQPFDLPCYR